MNMRAFEYIDTARTRIRRFQPKDREKLVELLCDKNVTQFMAFPKELLSEKGISNLLETTIALYESDKPMLSYAIVQKENDDLVGATGYNPLADNEIEVFYALLPAYWGKGLASEILVQITDYALSSGEYHAVVAPITRANVASARVAEKAGYSNLGLQQHSDYDDLVHMFKKRKEEA